MNELQYWAHMLGSASHHPRGMGTVAQEVDTVVPEITDPDIDDAMAHVTMERLLEVFKDMLLDYKDFIDSDPEIQRQYEIYQAEKKLNS